MLRTENDATNLPQIRGTGEEHLRYFIENRLNYCDSKWYAGSYPEDNAVVRIYTPVDTNGVPLTNLTIPANANITVTSYSAMYAGVRYKANGTLYQERLEENETHTFVAPNETFNDTETAIYGASQLSSLGDLAPLYLGYIDVGAATKLVELKIGDGTPGYQNANLYHLAVGTNRLLKKIDIQNCIGFNHPLVLSGCPNIEEVYAKGSAITGVELPDSGYLKVLQLPATISNLTLKNQLYIEDFSMEGYNSLKTVQCENCPSIDTLTVLNNAPNVERVRLTNVDWEWDDASVLYELIERDIAGIDENGVNTDHMWIDGKCKIKNITGAEFAEIKRLYPYLELSYETLTSNLIFMSDDGEIELHRQTILNAGDGIDPVANGTIETPTKESTAQYHFTYGGWSLKPGEDPDDNALKNIEANRYVYVAFDKEIRSYTVNFYNVTELLESQTVEYGSDATYTGDTPVHPTDPDYFDFIGWKPEPTNITGDTNCYAQWYDNREITDDWATIAAACLDGTATEKYVIGAYKPVAITYSDGTSETIDFEVIAHDHDEIADDTNASWKFYNERTGTSTYSLFVYKGEIWGGRERPVCYHDGKTSGNGTGYGYSATLGGTYAPRMVVYKDEFHLITSPSAQGDPYHYKYDFENNDWVEVCIMRENVPIGPYYCKYVEYNGLLYAFSTNSNYSGYYTFDGSSWSQLNAVTKSTHNLDLTRMSHLIVYDGKIHMFIGTGYNEHYTFDGSEWTYVCTAPKSMQKSSLFVYNGVLHAIGGTANPTAWYVFTGTEWIDSGIVLPFNAYGDTCNQIVVYNGRLIAFNVNQYNDSGSYPILHLENPRAPLTFLAKNLLKDDRAFNSNNTQYHWTVSDLRTWCNGEFYNSLPEDLQTSINEVVKVSDASTPGKILGDSNDKIWICSAEEMGIDANKALDYGIINGQGYAYPVFTDNDSRKRTHVDGTVSVYFTRTSKTGTQVVGVYGDGGAFAGISLMSSRGVLPGFCI